MGLILELEESDFVGYIDDGAVYTAMVVGIKVSDRTWTDPDGNVVKFLEWKFTLVTDDKFDGRDVWGRTTTKFTTNPNCKLYVWAEAILGIHLPPRYRLDTDDLLDRQCRVEIAREEYEKDGTTRETNKVRAVLPAIGSLIAAEPEPF